MNHQYEHWPHKVPNGERREMLCGAFVGPASAKPNKEVTCDKCLKVIARSKNKRR